jgi:Holliday junction resolvase RusA-like endonuclease
MILLTVWGDPVPWKRPGINTRSGHIYDQQAAERTQYKWQIASQAEEKPLTVPLEVDIVCYMPIPKSISKIKRNEMLAGKVSHMKKPDIDNLTKWALDCMSGLVYVDDAQVTKLTAYKCYSDSPRTTICVREVIDGYKMY